MNAPLPPNETARLQALRRYQILDTLEEQAFNDITMLASFICDAPMAVISLVDSERQWFKSRVGVQATETPREHAFCAHAILKPEEVLVVGDAMADTRFSGNPLVTGDPHIRFYVGAPLITPQGDALGTICVMDRVARELPKDNIDALRALARQVIAQMELHRVSMELDRGAKELKVYQRQLEGYQRQIERANTMLESQSLTDELTGVNNRRAFNQALQHELARASRNDSAVSLLLVDIDKFKSFNDAYGHVAGDKALQEVARILSSHGRPFDLVARYGGEEFAIILPNTDDVGAIVVAERLRRAIEIAPWTNRTITIGVGASTTRAGTNAATLIVQADQALYHTKQHGGNQTAHADHI